MATTAHKPPPGAAADWTIPQEWTSYTAQEHATWDKLFIRRPDQLDYLEEPDVFHDVFGHVPLLANPVFGDYMQAYGAGGLRSMSFDALHWLARLYWYTVEFGL